MTPADFLPGRYIVNYDVPNPLTCRHKHACACHGEPPPRKADPKPKEKEYVELKRKLEFEFIDLAGRLSFALRPFPEARAAIDEVIDAFRERHPS